MNFSVIPIIVAVSYLIGEIMKLMLCEKNNQIIPLTVTIVGGVLGVIFFYIDPQILLNVDNFGDAFMLGLTSGASATGTNQIYKQLSSYFTKNK